MVRSAPHPRGRSATTGGPVNPYTPDAASIAAGREVYQSVCTPCHGPQGRGDGRRAASLNPPPADLTTHVPLHSEGALVGMIAAGIPRSVMAGFREDVSDEQTWHPVNFLRALEDADAIAARTPAAPPTPGAGS